MRIWIIAVTMLLAASPVFGNESPQALQDAFVKALVDNDVEGLAACYTPDAVNFPVGSLIGTGPDSVR